MDGELWSGRDQFQEIVSTVRKQDPDPKKWDKIKFMVFDGPAIKGDFQHRLNVLKKHITAEHKVCKLIKQEPLKNDAHLSSLMDDICGGKGEGVMLKDPKSKYEGRRSYSLLKVKRFEDTEAKVIGHQRGTGRCSGMLGALLCREKDGTEFKIGSGFDDSQRMKPPKIGCWVTFKF